MGVDVATPAAPAPRASATTRGLAPSAGVAWLCAGALVAIAVALVALTPSTNVDAQRVTFAVHLLLLAATAVAIVVAVSRLGASTKGWLVALSAAVFLAGGALLTLNGSVFPPGGALGDESFRIASVMRFSQALGFADFAYRGLPAFYPPLFFWVLGRVSAMSTVPAYAMVKVGLVAVAALVPLGAFRLWSRLTTDASVAAAVVVVGLAFHDWWEPYSWITLVVFVPWWLRFVLRVGVDRGPLSRREIVVGSLIGGALVLTYYAYFFVALLQLGALLVAGRFVRRRGAPIGVRVTRSSWQVLAGSALVSAPYWLPLALKVASTPGAQSLQNRYFDPSMIPLPAPFLSLNPEGVLMAIGLVYLLWTARSSALSFALATLLGAAYAWFVLGYVAFLADTPTLAAKTTGMIDAVLLAGAGLAVVDGWRRVALLADGQRLHALTPVCIAVAALAVVVIGNDAMASIPYQAVQRSAKVPSALLASFDHATRGRADNTIVLTDFADIVEYRPASVFNVWRAHYSNPASLFEQRARFLERLATEPDPDVVASALRHNRFDRVDSVVLHRDARGLTYTFYDDNFPHGARARTLTFSPGQLAPRDFTASTGPGWAIFVPRSRDAAAHLDRAQRAELARHFPGDLDR